MWPGRIATTEDDGVSHGTTATLSCTEKKNHLKYSKEHIHVSVNRNIIYLRVRKHAADTTELKNSSGILHKRVFEN